MSGFELERQSLSRQLSPLTEAASRLSGDDLNRDLLSCMQRSRDIVRDLYALYSDRPYVYARVMQQLAKVVGTIKIRKIHGNVVARAQADAQAALQRAENAKKPVLKSEKAGSAPLLKQDAAQSEAKEDEGEKEFTINLPKLGLNNVKVSVASADGTHSLTASQLPIPFVKSVNGSVEFKDKKAQKVTATGKLDAALFNDADVTIDLVRNGTEGSSYTPTVKIGVANLKVPGIDDGITAKLDVGAGETPVLEGELSGKSTMFKNVSVAAEGKAKTGGQDTSIEGKLSFSNGSGGGATAAVAAESGGKRTAKSGSGAAAAASAGISYTGEISLNAENGALSGAKGQLTLTNFSKVVDPGESINLAVDYDGQNFTAKLQDSVSFNEFAFNNASKGGESGGQTEAGGESKKGGKDAQPTTVKLTVESASYDNGLDATCKLSAKLGGLIQADGTVNIVKNALSGGTVTLTAEEVPVIGNKAFVTASLSGDVAIDESGFSGSATGNAQFKAGGQTISVNLDSSTFDSTGNFEGTVSLAQPVAVKSLKFEQLSANFSSSEGLTSADGTISLDLEKIKSDENGIKISYAEESLSASGKLKLLGASGGGAQGAEAGGGADGGGQEMATCDFTVDLTADSFNGNAKFTVTNDYKVGSSKLRILKDSTATVTINEQQIEPATFEGSYDYGHADGEGGQGAEASGGDAKSSGGKDAESKSPALMFKGTFTGCSYDVNTGMLSGTATADLESDLEYKSPLANVKIDSSRRGKDTAFTVEIADSAVQTISGTLCYEVNDVPIRQGKGKGKTMSFEGNMADFTLDVPGEKFSGTSVNSLRTDLWLIEETEKGNSLKLCGNKQTQITFVIADNAITGIELDASAEVKITNAVFEEGSEKFKINLKDATIDKDTLDISSEEATVEPLSAVKLVFGANQETKLTIDEKSSLSAVINASLVESLTLSAGFEGETSALKTQKPIKFKGSSQATVTDIQGAGNIDGDIDVEMSEDCIIDSIEEVDEITLCKGSKFGLSMTQNAVDQVSGELNLRYKAEAKTFPSLPKGFEAELNAKDMVYSVEEKLFNGEVSVKPTTDIVFKPLGAQEGGEEEGGASASFTLKAKGTSLNATVADNNLKALNGTAGFEANVALKKTNNNASADFTNGQATIDIDVTTGDVRTFDVQSDVALNVKLGDKITITSEGGQAKAHFDAQGLESANFSGEISVAIKLGKDGDEREAVFKIATEGINYTRDEGFSGAVKLSCDNEVKLGEVGKADDDGAGSYEYGLKASTVETEIVNNEIETIKGESGLYLRETVAENALHVTGDIAFDYNAKEDRLTEATGTATVQEKTLKTFTVNESSESLILKESQVTVNVKDDVLEKVSGTVNLALSDEKGEYLNFESSGEFDCINTDSVSGDVKATFVREKLIAKFGKVAFYVTESGHGGDTTFDCHIEKNQIQTISGALNVMFRKTGESGEEDFFAGSVSGSYDADNGNLTADGSIRLCKDIAFPEGNGKNGQFVLCEGSSGEAHITNGNIDTITGNLTVKIKSPKTNESETSGEITVTSTGTVDVAGGHVKEFDGTATLTGNFKLAKDLSLTSLQAGISIRDDKLQEISGAASIEYKKGDFTITGACNTFKWKKAEDGGEDDIVFNGELGITGFKNKLSGKATIDYSSKENKVTCAGELDFKITEWLSGKVNVNFDNGWDDPEISGSIDATGVEMIPGTTLMAFAKEADFHIPIYGPLSLNAGIGFGASLDMEPLTLDGHADIQPFRLSKLKSGALPDFKLEINAKTGLKLNASVAPYIGLELGITLLSAGVRVKGKAELEASATANVGGMIKGGDEGLSGELSLGFSVDSSASLSVIPELYAQAQGLGSVTYPIKEWKYDLGSIYSFKWGKKYKFGDAGASSEESDQVTKLPGDAKTKATEAKSGEVESKYGSKKSGGQVGDGKETPKLDSPSKVGKESFGKNVEGGTDSVGGIQQTIEQVTAIAKGLGAIGEAVGFIGGLITSFSGGPIGVAVFLAAKIISGELSLPNIKQKIKDIQEGAAAIKELLANNADLIKSFLPKPIVKIIDFFEDAKEGGLINKIVESIEKAINGMGSPMREILQPLIKFAKGRQEALGKIAQLFGGKMSASNIIKAVAGILGFAFGSIDALISTCKEMWSTFKSIFQACVKSGDIFVKYESRALLDHYIWQVKIPGLCNFKGEGKAGARIASEFLVRFAKVPKQKIK